VLSQAHITRTLLRFSRKVTAATTLWGHSLFRQEPPRWLRRTPSVTRVTTLDAMPED
jgi:hypothetical protein